MQWKLFPLKPPGLVLHGATNHRECKLLHIHTLLAQQHMRDNCTRLQIAPVLSCSRAKSDPGCSIHLNPSEQLQKLPPAVTPITMSTCTTFICSFFFLKKRWPVWAPMFFRYSVFLSSFSCKSTYTTINNYADTVHHHFSVFMLFPLFHFNVVAFFEVWRDR